MPIRSSSSASMDGRGSILGKRAFRPSLSDVQWSQNTLDEARKEEYEIRKFSKLKSRDASALNWSDGRLAGALTVLDWKNGDLVAIELHQNLLGFMGDRNSQFPTRLAQIILSEGLTKPSIRDEIYVQCIKQLTRNSSGNSASKGWQMLCLCVHTFGPSQELEPYLLNFLLANHTSQNASVSKGLQKMVQKCARYCLRLLTADECFSGLTPSIAEIQAYKIGIPVLIDVDVVGGTSLVKDLPVSPDLTSRQVSQICSQIIGIDHERRIPSIGLFVQNSHVDPTSKKKVNYYVPLPLDTPLHSAMRTELDSEEEQRLVYKWRIPDAKIVRPQAEGYSDRYPRTGRVEYLSALSEVLEGDFGNTLRDTSEAALLATLAYRIAIHPKDDQFPVDAKTMAESKEFPLASVLQQRWQFDRLPEQWAEKMLEHRDAVLGKSKEECQDWFVRTVAGHDFFCSYFYRCTLQMCSGHLPETLSTFNERPGKKEVRIAVGGEAVSVMTLDYEVLVTMDYDAMHEWRAVDATFSCSVVHGAGDEFELTLGTKHCASIQAAIVEHINRQAEDVR